MFSDAQVGGMYEITAARILEQASQLPRECNYSHDCLSRAIDSVKGMHSIDPPLPK